MSYLQKPKKYEILSWIPQFLKKKRSKSNQIEEPVNCHLRSRRNSTLVLKNENIPEKQYEASMYLLQIQREWVETKKIVRKLLPYVTKYLIHCLDMNSYLVRNPLEELENTLNCFPLNILDLFRVTRAYVLLGITLSSSHKDVSEHFLSRARKYTLICSKTVSDEVLCVVLSEIFFLLGHFYESQNLSKSLFYNNQAKKWENQRIQFKRKKRKTP